MAEIISSTLTEEPGSLYQTSYTHHPQENTSNTTPLSNGWGTRYQHRQHRGGEDMAKLDLLQKQYQDLHTQHQNLLAAFNQYRRNSDGMFQMHQSLELAFDMERQLRAEKELRCQVLQTTLDAYEGKSQVDKQQADILNIITKLMNMLHVPQAPNGIEGCGSSDGQ